MGEGLTEDNGLSEANENTTLRGNEDLAALIRGAFSLKPVDAAQYSALALAYIGDNVYEFVNRTVAVMECDKKVNKLHRECSERANAGAQAKVLDRICGLLTEEEQAIYHRGRNAEVYTKAKNATTGDYHKATGLEALIGYLYLSEKYERLVELIKMGWEEQDV